jgi:hypothetical protein
VLPLGTASRPISWPRSPRSSGGDIRKQHHRLAAFDLALAWPALVFRDSTGDSGAAVAPRSRPDGLVSPVRPGERRHDGPQCRDAGSPRLSRRALAVGRLEGSSDFLLVECIGSRLTKSLLLQKRAGQAHVLRCLHQPNPKLAAFRRFEPCRWRLDSACDRIPADARAGGDRPTAAVRASNARPGEAGGRPGAVNGGVLTDPARPRLATYSQKTRAVDPTSSASALGVGILFCGATGHSLHVHVAGVVPPCHGRLLPGVRDTAF